MFHHVSALCLVFKRTTCLENSSSHVPCTRSHQPLPGSPLPRRNHLGSLGRGGGTEQGQGCGRHFPLVIEPASDCKETHRGCTCMIPFHMTGTLRIPKSHVVMYANMHICYDTRHDLLGRHECSCLSTDV